MTTLYFRGLFPPRIGSAYALLAVRFALPNYSGDGIPVNTGTLYEGRALVVDGRLLLTDQPTWPAHFVQPLDWPLDVLEAAAQLLPEADEEDPDGSGN